MFNILKKTKWEREDFRLKLGFIGASLTMIFIYAASSSPIPLYATYQTMFGISKSIMSISAVFYFVGTVITLLIFGRISDYLGRRFVIVVTIILSILGCIMFLFLNNPFMFLFGRLLQGFSCGMASSCVAAYIVDTSSNSKGLGAIITSSATMVGLAIGSFGAGTLIGISADLISNIFWVLIFILIICAILILLGEETIKFKKGVVKSIKPEIKVPKNIRHLLPVATAIFVGTWAVGGFYQAFSSSIAVEQFGISNGLFAASIFASLMAPQIIGSSFVNKFNVVKAQRIGMFGFFVSFLLIILALNYKLMIIFLVANLFAAICIGLSFTSTLNNILDKSNIVDRAGVLSTVYMISYGGTAIPNFLVGQIANDFSLFQIALLYGVLVLIATIITFFGTYLNSSRCEFNG